MVKIKKYNVQELVRYARKYERYISNKDNKKDLLYESKKNIMKGQLQGKIVDYNLELAKVEQDSDDLVKEQQAEINELKARLANITDENEKISQKLKEIESQKEILQGQQERVLEVFGDRMNKWKNDPRKKWQYETVKEMGEDIGIKVSTKQQDK